MALVRWKDGGNITPWSAFQDLDTQMNRLFSEIGREFNWPERTWMPTADLRETSDHYVIEMDLPGMSKDDIELTVIDNVLTIKGERKFEHQEGGQGERGYRRYERRYGQFQRSFELPGGFDGEKVDAHYENGVLRVTLPKREEAKAKQIEVHMN